VCCQLLVYKTNLLLQMWYGVAEKYAHKLENVAKNMFYQSYIACHQFLRHKMYVMSPAVLKNQNVPYGKCLQRPGEKECVLSNVNIRTFR
jgi:hypothetical protein